MTPETLAREIVAREGGFVDDPDDPGGATKYGVTIGTLRRLGLDLDGDGDVDAGDVRAVTVEDAVRIFLRDYYHRPGLHRLPESVQPCAFDFYVNAGAAAVRVLQKLLNDAGTPGTPIAVDGVVGPLTARAAHAAAEVMGAFLPDAYAIARRDWYYRLADRRPASRKYACRRDGGKGGWITRAEQFMRPKYRLTESQHRARVAGWV